MPECEIVELHHDAKLDAPSGTALRTAQSCARRAGTCTSRSTRCGEGAGRPPGGHLRRAGPDPDHPPRFDVSRVLHARRPAGDPAGGRPDSSPVVGLERLLEGAPRLGRAAAGPPARSGPSRRLGGLGSGAALDASGVETSRSAPLLRGKAQSRRAGACPRRSEPAALAGGSSASAQPEALGGRAADALHGPATRAADGGGVGGRSMPVGHTRSRIPEADRAPPGAGGRGRRRRPATTPARAARP